MLIPQKAVSETRTRQGCLTTSLAELRRQLANPSDLNDGNRQCLLNLANRLARVQALGDGFARVALSEHVVAAVGYQSAVQ